MRLPYSAAIAMVNGKVVIILVEAPCIVLLVANDHWVTAFVVSMFKTNANVRRFDLERGKNAVNTRSRSNISVVASLWKYQTPCENGSISNGKLMHDVFTTTSACLPQPHHAFVVLMTLSGRCYDSLTTVVRLHHVIIGTQCPYCLFMDSYYDLVTKLAPCSYDDHALHVRCDVI